MSFAEQTRVQAADSPSVDAFSRWRISDPRTLFATQSLDMEPLLMESGQSGTGVAPSHNANTRMCQMSATAGSGTSWMQSFQYSPYQPGKSQLILITGNMDTGVAGVVKDVGYFDAANGIFYRQNGASGVQFVRRSSTSGSVVDEVVNQASWNLDKLDGTGGSGYTLDPTKVFILVIDLQFLAMGRVRIGFDLGGTIIYAHQFTHANVLTVPYMQTATLPVQALLTASSSGNTANLYFKCAAVISEGGFDVDAGIGFSTPSVTVTAGNGTRTHLLSVRPKLTFNGIVNRHRLLIDSLELLVTGNNAVLWELVVGATFSVAPTFADVNTTYSAHEYGSGGTFSALTSGVVISAGYCATNGANKVAISGHLNTFYPLTLNRAGANRALGTLSLLVTGLGGTSASNALFNYIEIP